MKIYILRGDITEVKADVIVNAANKTLLGGGGVDGAIHRKAGPGLLAECKKIRSQMYPDGLPVGMSVITGAYNLPARYVVHTVGPIFQRDDIELLKRCYTSSLALAEEYRCKSIAFPAISTGIYRVPVDISAEIVRGVLDLYRSSVVKLIVLVLYKQEDYDIYWSYFRDVATAGDQLPG